MIIKTHIWKIINWLHKYIAAPRMVLGYKRHDGVYLTKTRLSNSVDIIRPDQLDIGDNVFIWHHSILECSNGVAIEEGCQIGANVLITSHSSHIAIRLYGRHYIGQPSYIGYITGKVKIGKYSFIGPYSTIMPETQIGKGSIVAAYSLVKGTFPDFAIIAGNPAKMVGDTRKMDRQFFEANPELYNYYNEWAD